MVAFPAGSVIRPDELARLLERAEPMRLLDVRTPGEYESGHIHGTRNVPLGSLGGSLPDLRTEPQTPVVLVCRSGARARTAEAGLRAAGMPRVLVLAGGMTAWAAAGQPVTGDRAAKPGIASRQVRMLGGMGLLLLSSVLASSPLGLLAAGVGSGLVLSGLTGTCFVSSLLSRLPCNRAGGAGCDLGPSLREASASGAAGLTSPTGR